MLNYWRIFFLSKLQSLYESKWAYSAYSWCLGGLDFVYPSLNMRLQMLLPKPHAPKTLGSIPPLHRVRPSFFPERSREGAQAHFPESAAGTEPTKTPAQVNLHKQPEKSSFFFPRSATAKGLCILRSTKRHRTNFWDCGNAGIDWFIRQLYYLIIINYSTTSIF